MRNRVLFVCGVCACLALALIDTRIIREGMAGDSRATDKSDTVNVFDGDGNAVVISPREGGFLAFYRPNKSPPRLAVSANGLQIVGADGKIRFIDLDELASLDQPRK